MTYRVESQAAMYPEVCHLELDLPVTCREPREAHDGE